MKNKIILTLIVLSVLLSVSSVNAGIFDSSSNNQNDLNVTDVKVSGGSYSSYDVSCKVTPKKDFNYLELYVIFYDNDGAVVGKSPLVWNMNSPVKDQLIKVSGTAYIDQGSGKPTRAEVYISDTPFTGDNSNAIFAQNVTVS